MKVEREKEEFKPVVITLETEEELHNLTGFIGSHNRTEYEHFLNKSIHKTNANTGHKFLERLYGRLNPFLKK